MLFQGQEFASSRPFRYFADLRQDPRALTHTGRLKFLSQFPSLLSANAQKCVSDPTDPRTFEGCKLDFSERTTHGESYALHRDLLRLRREDPVIGQQRRSALDGAVLGAAAFMLRYFGKAGDDRLLIVNLGVDLHLSPAPNRYWPHRTDVAGSCDGRVKIPATVALGFGRWKPMRIGQLRGTPPCC